MGRELSHDLGEPAAIIGADLRADRFGAREPARRAVQPSHDLLTGAEQALDFGDVVRFRSPCPSPGARRTDRRNSFQSNEKRNRETRQF